MLRFDIAHMNIWVASECRYWKSQKLLWAIWACGTSTSGSGFAAWIKSVNLMASWMKRLEYRCPRYPNCPPQCRIWRQNLARHTLYRRYLATQRPKNRRESKADRYVLRSVGQNSSTGHFFGFFVELESSGCTGTAGMDYSFGDTLVAEVVCLWCWLVVFWVGLQTIADLLSCMTIL